MNNRLISARGDQIVGGVVEAKRAMEELKTRQIIGGDSLAFYQSDSGAAYDWSGLLPESPPAPTTGHKILVVEAAAATQETLFADLIFELYVGSMSNRWTVRDYLAAIDASTPAFLIFQIPQPLDVDTRNIARFGIAIMGDKTTTCFAKFYVVANDTVVISITEKN